MSTSFRLPLVAAALALLASPAFAVTAHTTTDAKFQIGPGAKYAVVGVVAANTRVDVIWCGTDGHWCLIDVKHRVGWVPLAALAFASPNDKVAVLEDGSGKGPSGPAITLASPGNTNVTLAGDPSTIDTDPPKPTYLGDVHINTLQTVGGLHLSKQPNDYAKMP